MVSVGSFDSWGRLFPRVSENKKVKTPAWTEVR